MEDTTRNIWSGEICRLPRSIWWRQSVTEMRMKGEMFVTRTSRSSMSLTVWGRTVWNELISPALFLLSCAICGFKSQSYIWLWVPGARRIELKPRGKSFVQPVSCNQFRATSFMQPVSCNQFLSDQHSRNSTCAVPFASTNKFTRKVDYDLHSMSTVKWANYATNWKTDYFWTGR
jgi:hypothetical protein